MIAFGNFTGSDDNVPCFMMPHHHQYEPIDDDSADEIIRRRKHRYVRIGVIGVTLLVIVMAVISHHQHGSSNSSGSQKWTRHKVSGTLQASSMPGYDGQSTTTMTTTTATSGVPPNESSPTDDIPPSPSSSLSIPDINQPPTDAVADTTSTVVANMADEMPKGGTSKDGKVTSKSNPHPPSALSTDVDTASSSSSASSWGDVTDKDAFYATDDEEDYADVEEDMMDPSSSVVEGDENGDGNDGSNLGPSSSSSDRSSITEPSVVLSDKIVDRLIAGLLADEEAFYFPSAPTSDSPLAGSKNTKRTKKTKKNKTKKMKHRLLRKVHKTKKGHGSTKKHDDTVLKVSSNKEDEDDSIDTFMSIIAMDWTLDDTDWKKNGKNLAAIGSYYIAKGEALASYYNSLLFDALGGGANVTDPPLHVVPITSDWMTTDWQDDWESGMALSDIYIAIGTAINEHYQAMYAPPMVPNSSDSDETRRRRRQLQANDGIDNVDDDGDNTTNTTATISDWQTDRERGMAIGEYYQRLGQLIATHYATNWTRTTTATSHVDDDDDDDDDEAHGSPEEDEESKFDRDEDVDIDIDTNNNEAVVDPIWEAYKAEGNAIADYYKSKGRTIEQLYNSIMYGQNNRDDDTNDESGVNGFWNTTTTSNNNGTIQSLLVDDDLLLKELAGKGKRIEMYYQARYDPDYKIKTLNRLPQHDPNLEYPPWGMDPNADRAHRKAIGRYWAKYNHVMNQYYHRQGPMLGTYYDDYYRRIFDPMVDDDDGNTANDDRW